MKTLSMHDGRQLQVQVSGPADGVPLVFHHGTPGAVPPVRAIERAAHAQGLCHVSFSRPGYGSSSRLPGRDVAAAAADVTALLDRIGAERCVVAGWSGGGPHALATAALLPGRVAGVLTIAGLAPQGMPDLDFLAGMGETNLEEFGPAFRGEEALRPYLERKAAGLRGADAAGLREGMRSLLSPVDHGALTDEFAADLSALFTEALSTDVGGWADDILAFTRPWGFCLDAIAAPAFVWQGSEDLMVPFAHGRRLAAHLPGATAHLEEGEGHFTVPVAAAERMLEELAGVL